MNMSTFSNSAKSYVIKKKCRGEMKTFCNDARAGRGQRLICLNLHRNETNFGDACRAALAKMPQLEAMTPKQSDWGIVEELKVWFESHQKFTDKYGKVLFGGIVGLVAVLT